jgi:hypothetical protein
MEKTKECSVLKIKGRKHNQREKSNLPALKLLTDKVQEYWDLVIGFNHEEVLDKNLPRDILVEEWRIFHS